jgi:hypothetical protein
MPQGRRALQPRRHTVFELAPGLLLVFKPRGHAEPNHSHAYRQRLRVLSGLLTVRTLRRSLRIDCTSRAMVIAAGRLHSTLADADTWLIAEDLSHAAVRHG